MTKHIRVGYDGAPASAEAVVWAADEAERRGVPLHVVSCFQMPVSGVEVYGFIPTEAIASMREAADVNLREIQATVATRHPGIDVSVEAAAGPASSVLVEGLNADDLLVVGASNHTGVAAFWLGSTPRHLVRHSPCPVVVVRGAASRGRPDRIVVGVDGSPTSEIALRWAGDEADLHQVGLHVVHAWSYPYIGADAVGTSSQARDLTEIDAACLLDKALESSRERIGAATTSSLVERPAVTGLLESVRDGDLLVVGASGHGAFMAGLLGSTVNMVLERAAVPVVVVPSPAS